MKYLDEYRDAKTVKAIAQKISSLVTRSWTIMEVCGGQTHAIVKFGLDQLLPDGVALVHGPGCPVCVTPVEAIDKAIHLALQPDVILCSFGDMLRVPGTKKDLLTAKSEGGDIRIVYSPSDTIKIAQEHSDKHVVFFAVGFETTAPANAIAIDRAKQLGLDNISFLVFHVLVPPAIETVLASPDNCIQGFLAAGHVCAVMGYEQYEELAKKYRVPIVVTGFEPVDILQGIYLCIKQLEDGKAQVDNEYARVVHRAGNKIAQDMMNKVFCVENRKWRGIGEISQSGLGLAEGYEYYDAQQRFDLKRITAHEDPRCIAGAVLQGIKKPNACGEFGKACTPEHPLGAPMVSSEGACSAYYKYRKQ